MVKTLGTIIWCNPAMELTEIRKARLQQVVDEYGLKQAAFLLGKPASQIADMLAGRKSFGEKVARSMEESFAKKAGGQRPVGWLDGANTSSNVKWSGIDPADLVAAGALKPGIRTVPVVGMARLGDNGYYDEVSDIPGVGDGVLKAYSDDDAAYALRVRGDSMFPAIRDGWYVVIEPRARAVPGEYVLVKLKTGQKMVKELVIQKPDSITVMSVNGETRRTIMLDEIDDHMGIQPVAAILSPSKWRPE